MIVASFTRDGSGYLRGFTLQGHAELAAYGSDPLCAAISTLGQTAIMAVHELSTLPFTYQIDPEAGEITLDVETQGAVKRAREDCHLIIKQCLIGVKMAAEAYPDHLSYRDETGEGGPQ